jgi:uncharacterized protein YfkK (UPF0435 family)
MSDSEVVENFAKKQKETKTMAKEEDIKSNAEMIEGKNEISFRNIDGIAGGLRHIHTVSYQPMKQSRFNIYRDKFI